MTSGSLVSTVLDIIKELLEPNDFSISTWMAMGAALFLGAQYYLPVGLGSLLPLLYLGFRFAKTIVDIFRLHKGCFTNMRRGRWIASLGSSRNGEPANNGSDGIVMFVLGARLNHPLQKLAPGASEMNDLFQDMWREAENNRHKWGYLGRTNYLVDYSDGERTPTIWLSYWKDLSGLHEFSKTAAHRLGQDRYNANHYPHIGVMHETYYATKGCWETMYREFPPWGLGAAKDPIVDELGQTQLRNILEPATKQTSMFSRMGRKNAEG